MADSEIVAVVRLIIDMYPEGEDVKPKALLDTLQSLDERFNAIGKEKFKRILAKAKELPAAPASAPAEYAICVAKAKDLFQPSSEDKADAQDQPVREGAGKSGGYSSSDSKTANSLSEDKENVRHAQEPQIVLTRTDLSRKFGMMIGVDKAADGGHAITSIRQGGVLDDWNVKNPTLSIRTGDILMSVNSKTSFEEMMSEFGQSLSCTLKLQRANGTDGKAREQTRPLKEDDSEAAKEKAEWEKRRARVTAALIPGLKKIIDSEFGPGSAARITRVEHMYERIGRNEVFERDDELGKVYAPGYMEGLQPNTPWHNTQEYPWCADLSRQWKAIRTELRNCLEEDGMWTPGAYQASNEAYGTDWKIMGVYTADQWRDEKRFKNTSAIVRQLKNVKPFEVFFAKMPAGTKIAPHSDNLNYILTSHLALELEEGSCLFKVGNEERAWKEGEMLIADTSFIHSCVNQSSRARYVLVFRFWHPQLSNEELRAIQLSHAILAKASEK